MASEIDETGKQKLIRDRITHSNIMIIAKVKALASHLR
jgi:hypothetical protein